MKIYTYIELDKLNEIQFGNVLPYEFNTEIKKELDEFNREISYIEFEYTNEIGEEKIVSVDFRILKPTDIKYLEKNSVNINHYLYEDKEKIEGDLIFIYFWERLKGTNRDSNEAQVDRNTTNSSSMLYRKMTTVIDIIKYISQLYQIKWFIFQPSRNDVSDGKYKEHNKRDFLYSAYLLHYGIKNFFCYKPYIIDDGLGGRNSVLLNFSIIKL